MAEKIAKFRFSGYKIIESSINIDPEKEVGQKMSVEFRQTDGVEVGEHKMHLVLDAHVNDDANALEVHVKALGFFEFDDNLSEEMKAIFFKTSAPAILFPYVRAYISTLSSLSGIKPIILPTLNMSQRDKQ